jgi:hypothetical protein
MNMTPGSSPTTPAAAGKGGPAPSGALTFDGGQPQPDRHAPGGQLTPAPPAWLLGLLGLPVFWFLARRRPRPSGED